MKRFGLLFVVLFLSMSVFAGTMDVEDEVLWCEESEKEIEEVDMVSSSTCQNECWETKFACIGDGLYQCDRDCEAWLWELCGNNGNPDPSCWGLLISCAQNCYSDTHLRCEFFFNICMSSCEN